MNYYADDQTRVLPNVQAPEPAAPPEREPKTIKGRDGFNYWMSGPQAGQRVLPEVEAPPEGPEYLRDPINMINQGTGEVQTAQTQSEVSQWSAQGYEIAGESTIEPTRKVVDNLQNKIVDTQEASSRLGQIKSSLDPKFLELPFQAKMFAASKYEKLGTSLPDSVKQELQEYSTFKLNAAENLNRYIKEITGAQMSEVEAKRLMKAMPNIKDSPSEFTAKFDAIVQNLEAANDRYIQTLSLGLGEKTTDTPAIEKMSDEEIDMLLSRLVGQ